MAALVEGQQFSLSSKGQLNDKKTRIFVKLTDSALKAIEDYLSIRVSEIDWIFLVICRWCFCLSRCVAFYCCACERRTRKLVDFLLFRLM